MTDDTAKLETMVPKGHRHIRIYNRESGWDKIIDI